MDKWTAEEATRELLSVLPLLNRIMASELRQEAGEETTMPQFRVLAYLAEGPLTLSEIARRRRVSLQAAGELVQILVARGWVKRTPDPNDRRQSMLTLTDEGKQRYGQAQEGMVKRLIPLVKELTGAELAAAHLALPALGRVLAREAAQEQVEQEEMNDSQSGD